MKRFLTVIIAVFLTFSLAACRDKNHLTVILTLYFIHQNLQLT